MLIRTNIDGVTRHYCADCVGRLGEAAEGRWSNKGTCCRCGLVAGGKGRRVKVEQAQARPVLPLLTDEETATEEARLVRALTGTEEDRDATV